MMKENERFDGLFVEDKNRISSIDISMYVYIYIYIYIHRRQAIYNGYEVA
jgi:hypothetical protein